MWSRQMKIAQVVHMMTTFNGHSGKNTALLQLWHTHTHQRFARMDPANTNTRSPIGLNLTRQCVKDFQWARSDNITSSFPSAELQLRSQVMRQSRLTAVASCWRHPQVNMCIHRMTAPHCFTSGFVCPSMDKKKKSWLVFNCSVNLI